MWAKSFLPVNLTSWETWVVFGIGAFTASLTLLSSLVAALSAKETDREGSRGGRAPVRSLREGQHHRKAEVVRREGNPVEVFITDAEEKIEPIRGWVVDRSLGGVRLLVYGWWKWVPP